MEGAAAAAQEEDGAEEDEEEEMSACRQLAVPKLSVLDGHIQRTMMNSAAGAEGAEGVAEVAEVVEAAVGATSGSAGGAEVVLLLRTKRRDPICTGRGGGSTREGARVSVSCRVRSTRPRTRRRGRGPATGRSAE